MKRIAIIGGCGHVGLPLGIAIALRGYHVDLIDTDLNSVKKVQSGVVPFVEKGGNEALRQVIDKTLFASSKPDNIKEADVIISVTGTNVDEHLNPRIKDIIHVINDYVPFLSPGQLLILRSTLFPGTMELIYKHLKSKCPDVHLAFCPERVAQGFAIEEIQSIPQIVAAFEPEAERLAAELFGNVSPSLLFLSPKEAELTKLFANSWRYIHFAIANQFYVIAEANGVDFNRIYGALTQNYPRANYVKPGFTAGPCLFKDTMQLSAFHNNNFFLGHAAMLINEGLPQFIVEQLEQKLGSLDAKKIGLLGMAFKPNNDDIRYSLSYKTRKILETKRAIVLETDVYQDSAPKLQEIIQTADGIILGVPHKEYLDINLRGKPFIDCWGVWKKAEDLSWRRLSDPLKKAA